MERPEPTDIEGEILRGLLRGATPEDLGWALGTDSDEVLAVAHTGLERAGGATSASRSERRRVGGYLLGGQSPGQAAGTWEALERSAELRAWARRVSTSLAELFPGGPPALPGDEDASSPAARARDARSNGGGALAARRAQRARMKTHAEVEQAVAVAQSPFREEAIAAHREADTSVKLPHFASRPTRVALYALLGISLMGLVFCALASVPTHQSGKALVVDARAGAPGGRDGLSVLALFPPSARDDLSVGQRLRVQLPDTDERVATRLFYVADRTLSPKEIIRRFGLSREQANRVRGPAAVAVAELHVPPESARRASFEGAVTNQATLRTGSQTILGLLL